MLLLLRPAKRPLKNLGEPKMTKATMKEKKTIKMKVGVVKAEVKAPMVVDMMVVVVVVMVVKNY